MIVLKGLNRITRRIPVNLFFLELIIVLLFFSVAGGVILRMFVSAHVLAEKNTLFERTALKVQSISEMYAVCGDMDQTVDELFGYGVSEPIDLTYETEEDKYDPVTGKPYPQKACTVYLDRYMHPLVTPDGKRDYGVVRLDLYETKTDSEYGTLSEMKVCAVLVAYLMDMELIYDQSCSTYIPDYERTEENA